MKYIEAPKVYQPKPEQRSIFLAGGISGCPDWQQELVHLLSNTALAILNPRRKVFLENDPNARLEQTAWEYEHLRKADAIAFWFPSETLCPIVLYELGAWSMSRKPIYVGLHPNYERRPDIEVQTRLARPDVEIVYSLPKLAAQIGQSMVYTYSVGVRADNRLYYPQ
jgi:hypothetical protein